ncbi:hypothetical protein F4861DRAFT_526881 [Xylaria intraflava]|nr:hypothetical protein F4861DRAFT_526881 [Xylaria intraflava]
MTVLFVERLEVLLVLFATTSGESRGWGCEHRQESRLYNTTREGERQAMLMYGYVSYKIQTTDTGSLGAHLDSADRLVIPLDQLRRHTVLLGHPLWLAYQVSMHVARRGCTAA